MAVTARSAAWRSMLAAIPLLYFAAAGQAAGGAGSDAEPAARVNGTAITQGMVREVVKSVIAESAQPPSGDEIERLGREALDSLIDLELLYQEAVARKIRVAGQEIDNEIQRSRSRFADAAQFDAALQRTGMSEARLRDDTKKTLLADHLLRDVVWRDIRIAPEAARAFYEENRAEFAGPAGVTPFEEVRDRIIRVLTEEEKERRRSAFVAQLRTKAKIAVLGPAAPTPAATANSGP